MNVSQKVDNSGTSGLRDNVNVEVIVKKVRKHRTFREMLKTEPLNEILPNVKTVDEGINVYRKFYTTEQEEEFGVVALKVKRV